MIRRLSALVAGLALVLAPNLTLAQAAQWNYTQPPGANSLATYPGDVTILGTLNASGGQGAGVFTSLKNGQTGWLEPIAPFTESISVGESLSGLGRVGWLQASHCLNNAHTDDMGCIGGESFGVNDNVTNLQYSWAHYFEGRRFSGAGVTHSIEVNMTNFGSVFALTPYNFGTGHASDGITSGLWLSAGRPDVVSPTNVSCAICVLDNGAKFASGLVFKSTGLDTFGGVQFAGVLGQHMAWVWEEPATGTIRSQIRGEVTTATGRGGQIVATDNGMEIQDNAGVLKFRANAGANTGVILMDHIQASATGAAPVPSSCGTSPAMGGTSSDARMNLQIGTGTVTSCVITFNLAYNTGVPPVCVVTMSSTAVIPAITAATTTAITLGFSANAAGLIAYIQCLQ